MTSCRPEFYIYRQLKLNKNTTRSHINGVRDAWARDMVVAWQVTDVQDCNSRGSVL